MVLNNPSDTVVGNWSPVTAAPSAELISDCVHCGFCLPACPTYLVDGNEMDSPRGRIQQLQLITTGAAEMTTQTAGHFDSCLGCLACVSACPSGVQYDKLIVPTRSQVEQLVDRGRMDRWFRALIFALFPYPRRLRALAALGWLDQRLGLSRRIAERPILKRFPRLHTLLALSPDVDIRSLAYRTPALTAACGEVRARVGFVSGCVQQVFFARVNQASLAVLAAEGYEVVAPPEQECCGALSEHAGRAEEARRRARALIDAFAGTDTEYVLVNVAGCGSTLKEYGTILADDPEYAERARQFSARVRDITEFLGDSEPRAVRHPVPGRVAYHDACHLAHGQQVRSQPRRLLAQIPGLTTVDIDEAEICCGSAGIYNLLQPDTAAELGRRKAGKIAATEPDLIATANAGCLLQIGRYLPDVAVVHPIELLHASITGSGPISR